MRKIVLIFLLTFFLSAWAQKDIQTMIQPNVHASIMHEQSALYRNYNFTTDQQWDSLREKISGKKTINGKGGVHKNNAICPMQKRVYGWHPYWNGSTYLNYDWTRLTDFCYFDYSVNASSGANTNPSFAWSTSAAVTAAINNGVNAHICATLFSSHATFWANSSAQQTLITNLINLVQSRGGKGVNIDFEGMGSADKVPFTNFMNNLCTQMHSAVPGSEVSVALYAVDWSNTFDLAVLNQFVDYFIFMGYDYYWSGSTSAGPESPLYNFQTSYNYTLNKTITYYIKQGVTPAKLLAGLPYYGREWETTGSSAPSTTTGNFTTTRTYSAVRNNANGYYNTPSWEPNSFSNYYAFQVAGVWRQCWIDNALAYSYKYDVVNQRGLGGIGIWALGYDDGYSELWNLLDEKFSSCSIVPCSDTIWDTGGPNRNYYDNENYSFTIAPSGAFAIQLAFLQFDVELNYDTLFIYDGPSTTSALIGAYTGSNSPGTVTSTQSAITLRFKSDGATVKPGFTAIWTCLSDQIAPVTTLNNPPNWVTQNTSATFNDADNPNGSGVDKAFYNVSALNTNEWRSNNQNGFFRDDFISAIHPEWTIVTGTWVNVGGHLEQQDETSSNTNIFAPLNQNLADRYLFHWLGKIDGTGTNRRAGLHFFCDSAQFTNRLNSYFVWFRADQDQLQFYKVVNDVFYLEQTLPCVLNTGQWYDFKTTFDRFSGIVQVWVDDNYIGSWQDNFPLSIGNFISFRSGNCNYAVDNFSAYKSRSTSALVTVGPGNFNDIRYQNPAPGINAAQIRSLSKDFANNIGGIFQANWNVDWTSADTFGVKINDGLAFDIDTSASLTSFSANWNNFTDTNSAVIQYEFCIGSSPGSQDILPWTNQGLNFSATYNSLVLLNGQTYYSGIRAINGAGLISDPVISDGALVLISLSSYTSATESEFAVAYPNPVHDELNILFSNNQGKEIQTIEILDYRGAKLYELSLSKKQDSMPVKINTSLLGISDGVYFICLVSPTGKKIIPFVKQ